MKNALVIIAVAFLFCSTLMAQTGDRESLKGLTGVGVMVENLGPDAEKDGLTMDQIQMDVELRLRMAGIKVLTQEQKLETPGMPFLYVHLNAQKRQATYAFSIDISLFQWVNLGRDPQISVDASTWSIGVLVSLGADNVSQTRNVIKDYVDKFINAWLSVNPKK
jgi:hypothetical protein